MANSVLQSPLAERFPERATSKLQRLQAELGPRHSFREAARLMETFLPCAPQQNTTVRNRLARIAETLETTEAAQIDTHTDAKSSPLTVFLDGAHIRCEAQILIERWRRYYNTVRPHSSLGYRPPAPESFVPIYQRP